MVDQTRRNLLIAGGLLAISPAMAWAEQSFAPSDVDTFTEDTSPVAFSRPNKILAPSSSKELYVPKQNFSQFYSKTLWAQRGKECELIDVYTKSGYDRLKWLTRDIRAGDIVGIPSPRLVRQAVWLQARLKYHGHNKPFVILSGLRTAHATETTEGSARASKHLPEGKSMIFHALDIAMPGVDSSILAVLALEAHDGGVGYYGNNKHIHIDDGKPRFWKGKYA